MPLHTRRSTAVLFSLLAFLNGCTTPSTDETYVSLWASPSRIDDKGQTTTLQLEAFVGEKAGEGKVQLTATAGLFPDGAEVTLEEGAGSATFACAQALDANCKGSVQVTAEWKYKDAVYSATAVIRVGEIPDAGSPPPATDGGTDGGIVSDAGTSGVYNITLTLEKDRVVAGSGDKVDITAKMKLAATGAVIENANLRFDTTEGSFDEASVMKSTIVTTNEAGEATVTFYGTDSFPGQATIEVTGEDASALVNVTLLDVANIVYVANNSTKTQLGIQSSSRDTTTPLYFQVTDSSGNGVAGVNVSFTQSGPAGITSTPSGVTNSTGQVFSILQSGNDVGVASVTASVTAAPTISATSPGTPIVGGTPSDRGFLVKCDRKNMGAMHETVPPRVLTTTCRARLVDRFGNPVGLATNVVWIPEAGSIDSPVLSKAQSGTVSVSDTGEATTIFRSTSIPRDVTPLLGEPSSGTQNPRDMLVSLIAVVSGEEEFYDGSGASNGVKNGKWDPGEWFVDLPEPFVDANDNNQYDTGEEFIDTERKDCANPNAPATTNNKWDPPNGCWDSDTQIWRTAHIVYSGPLSQAITLNPLPSYVVPVSGALSVGFTWGDAWFGRLSPDGAGIAINKLTGSRGSATVSAPGIMADDYGFTISYERVEAVESTVTPGVFTVLGTCNELGPAPGNTQTRCLRRYTVDEFQGGTQGTILFTGASSVGTPENMTFSLDTTHAFSTPSSTLINAIMQ